MKAGARGVGVTSTGGRRTMRLVPCVVKREADQTVSK